MAKVISGVFTFLTITVAILIALASIVALVVAVIGFVGGQLDKWGGNEYQFEWCRTLLVLGVAGLAGSACLGFGGTLLIKLVRSTVERRQELLRDEIARAEEARKKVEAVWAARRLKEQRLASYVLDADVAAATLPQAIALAEEALDRAECEFRGRYYSRFWQEVEKALKMIAEYDRLMRRIEALRVQYAQEAAGISGATKFPLRAKLLPDAARTLERIEAVSRQAERDQGFATIKILIAGFTSIAGALNAMTSRIEGELAEIGSNLGLRLGRLDQALCESAELMGACHEESMQAARECREEERRAAGEAAVAFSEEAERDERRSMEIKERQREILTTLKSIKERVAPDRGLLGG